MGGLHLFHCDTQINFQLFDFCFVCFVHLIFFLSSVLIKKEKVLATVFKDGVLQSRES